MGWIRRLLGADEVSEGWCLECGEWLLVPHTPPEDTYCSETCRQVAKLGRDEAPPVDIARD